MSDYERDFGYDRGNVGTTEGTYGTQGATTYGEGRGSQADQSGPSRGMRDRAKRRASEMGQRANGVFDDHPLVIGVGVALLGTLIGMVLPRTRAEDRMMGRASGRVTEMARGKAEELRGAAQRTFERVSETAREELEQHGLTPEDLKGKAAEAKDVAKNVAKEAQTAAKEEAGKARQGGQGGGGQGGGQGGGSKS